MGKFTGHKWSVQLVHRAARDDKREVIFRCRRCGSSFSTIRKENRTYDPPTREELHALFSGPVDRDCDVQVTKSVMDA